MSFEVRSQNSGVINFSAINREFSIPVDISTMKDLVDIKLQFYSSPSMEPLVNSFQMTGGEDYRFYLNSHNVTQSLIEELRTQISNIDHEVLSEAYLSGARSYIDFTKRFNSLADRSEQDWITAQEIAEDRDWSGKVSKLGDHSVGWSGNLHCLNFLYKFIPLFPLSLSHIWERHLHQNQLTSEPRKLSDFKHLVLTFSQGGSPSFDTFETDGRHPTGRLCYTLEIHHRNPLEPRLKEIARKLRDLHRQLEMQRIEYLTPIKSGVETANDDISKGYLESKISLDRLTETVKKIR